MSTDSTELTFVRCPSCRSLVPAVSTRCRMCGANLENAGGGAAQGEHDKQEKSGGRVRQRTMSQAEHELSSVVEQVRTEAVQEPVAPAPKKEAMLIEDPLSAYLEEVEVEEGLVQESPKPEPGFPASETQNGGSFEAPAKEVKASRSNEPAPMMRGQKKEPSSFEAPMPDDKGKLIVESGSRKFGKPSGLSFGKGGDQPPKIEVAPVSPKETIQEPPQQRKERSQSSRETVVREPRREEPQREERREERRAERREESREERREERREEAPRREAREQPLSSSKSLQEEGSEGVLVGWLVSFDKPERSAIELRSGKFFVTSSRMRPSDLVLTNQSISSPHALVVVGDNGVVKVQDLMSEQGVFVKRATGGSSREQEVTSLDHGDTVRFGNVEFVISLLPKVSGR